MKSQLNNVINNITYKKHIQSEELFNRSRKNNYSLVSDYYLPHTLTFDINYSGKKNQKMPREIDETSISTVFR